MRQTASKSSPVAHLGIADATGRLCQRAALRLNKRRRFHRAMGDQGADAQPIVMKGYLRKRRDAGHVHE